MRFFGGKIDIMSTGFSWIHNLLRQIGQGYANVCIGFLVLNGWTHATIVQLEKIYELSPALCSPLNSKGFSVNQETRRVTCCYYVFDTMGWNPFLKIMPSDSPEMYKFPLQSSYGRSQTTLTSFFDHLLPFVDSFYLIKIDILDYLTTSSCKHSLWTTPLIKQYLI